MTSSRFKQLDPIEQASYLATQSESEREAIGWRLLQLEDDGLSADDVFVGEFADDGPEDWSTPE
jgi:hypothetical protein